MAAWPFNKLSLEQNDQQFTNIIFHCIFLQEKLCILTKTS